MKRKKAESERRKKIEDNRRKQQVNAVRVRELENLKRAEVLAKAAGLLNKKT